MLIILKTSYAFVCKTIIPILGQGVSVLMKFVLKYISSMIKVELYDLTNMIKNMRICVSIYKWVIYKFWK